MQSVVLFKPGDICHNSLGYWTDMLAGLLEERGLFVTVFEVTSDPQEMAARLDKLTDERRYDSVMAFNGNAGYILFKDILKEKGIPFYNYIVDHPLDHHTALENAFADYRVICVDKLHCSFIDKYFDKVSKTYFLPLAGMGAGKETVYDLGQFEQRPMDIVFTAGLYNTEDMIEALATYPEVLKNLMLSYIKYMLSHPFLTPEDALAGMLREQHGNERFTDAEFYQLAVALEKAIFFVRNYIREEIISVLLDAGISVHVFGNGWDKMKAKYPDKAELFHGEIGIDDTVGINEKAKLVLNVLPWFKAGSHDRIETAQLCGAAVITDDNPYLKEVYLQDEDILFYSNADLGKLPGIIRRALSDTKGLYELAQKGRMKAEKDMTWESLADKLKGILCGE